MDKSKVTTIEALTCEEAEGKLMPSSFRDLMVAPIKPSCGSFWKSSAHSTIRAFSFSHTLGWAYSRERTKARALQCFIKFVPIIRFTCSRSVVTRLVKSLQKDRRHIFVDAKWRKTKKERITNPAQHTPCFTGKVPRTDFQVEYFSTVRHTCTQQLWGERTSL